MLFLLRISNSVIVSGLIFFSFGQVTFTSVPVHLQVYGRDLGKDTTTVPIAGKVKRTGANYVSVLLKVLRNNVLSDSVQKTLTFVGDSALFTLNHTIKAELANYTFAVYGINGTQTTLIKSADSVVCGDVFIVTGQSNSVAWNLDGTAGNSANVNQSPFIRVFGTGCYNGSDSIWYLGQGDGIECTEGNTGQWGLRLARLIVDNQKIPVAIFNGGHGGKPIQFFQRNDANPMDLNTNYGRLLKRVTQTGLTQKIRAVIWHQGESNSAADTNRLSLAAYKNAYIALSTDWQTDYPSIEKLYIFQIRNGCNFPLDSVMTTKEAHRQLAQTPKVTVMSTSASNHYTDNCHYLYNNGYKSFGENMYRLLARDFYGLVGDNIDAPAIRFAEVTNNGLLATLVMDNIMDSISWVTGQETEFRFAGVTGIGLTGAKTEAYKVRLVLNGNASAMTAISFVGNQNTPEPMVTNQNGIGALHFLNFPITKPRYRDSVSVMAILKSNNITLPLDSVATFSANGRITVLKLANRKLTVIPREIGFMDSLKTIDISMNRLTKLPREITKIAPLTDFLVNYNYLCTVSDTITTWVNKYSKDQTWKTTQLLDSLHFCDGSTATMAGWKQRVNLFASSDEFTCSCKSNGQLVLRFTDPSRIKQVTILRVNGTVVGRYSRVPDCLTVDMSHLSRQLLLVQCTTTRGRLLSKVIAY
jgi:hypothetical protein